MKGGGIRGIAYGGALRELKRQGVLAHITRVGGTLAGAIQAALLAVGYVPEVIIDVINRTPVQRLNDGRYIFIGGGSRLLRQYGWYRGDQPTKYLCELVGRQTQRPNITLAELHQLALAPYDIRNFSSYIGALYTVALENLNPALLSDWPCTISINTMGFTPKVKRI